MILPKLKLLLTFSAIITLLISCSETKTNNVQETYKYWTSANAPNDIELLNGQYWQSAHFTKEYIMFLKFKPSKKWWNEFTKQNNLITDTTKWAKPLETPNWFLPTNKSLQFRQAGFSESSRYFCDTSTGICYIYEMQL